MGESAGRHQRFERVYREYGSAVFAYALRRVSADDAADVVAETFVVAWRRLDDLRSEQEALPWLYGIARRVISTHRRSGRRRQAISERVASETGMVIAPELRAEQSKLRVALGSLSPGEREVLMLTAWEDLDSKQAAVALGCSPTAFRLRLYRARRRLRARLADLDAEQAPASSPPLAPSIKEIS